MSDAEARAVGAGITVEVEGKEYRIRPLTMQQLQEIQREALKYYKRQFLQTYVDNRDLLGDRADELIEAKLEEASKWDIQQLPAKSVHDVSRIPVTDKLREWVGEKYGEVPKTTVGILAIVATALDGGEITVEAIGKMTGKKPVRVKAQYDAWWITSCYEGMLTMVRAGLAEGVPKNEVEQWPLTKIIEIARAIEQLTTPDLGNS